MYNYRSHFGSRSSSECPYPLKDGEPTTTPTLTFA